MPDELEWPSLEARRDRSFLLLFHKIHSGAVSIEKDKYLTPAHSLKSTRASHSAQYCRYQTYSVALKNSFSPELFHSGMVFLLLWSMVGYESHDRAAPGNIFLARRGHGFHTRPWSIPRLLRSLGHPSFSQNTAERFFLFFFV